MIDKEQALKLAKLSMIEFADDELNAIADDLSNIISFAGTIQNCNADVSSFNNSTEPINAFREDEIFKFDVTREDLLRESKTTEDGFFKIPKSIKGR